ncbi:methyltransferase family protein [Murinocardiopsis flavida]|uniref:Methyltransferase family protein n=1 Tax=Murinocardiopsis flavida TaxID=645275 RepID=A0A2P8DQP3_9ACTN|nr:class I SAM-dependent methyltransferase [Murinocardiopsis flavida]PSK99547.1 methyltransferase family protein [Murinocardiopsis flavida]
MPLDLSWNHNTHYHPWLLRQVPAGAERALDVGCGSGRFARVLAGQVAQVDAFDPAPAMIEDATERTPTRLGIDYTVARLAEMDLEPGRYHFISAVSSLHHMPCTESLDALVKALAPGGVLAVVGLYRPEGPVDAATTAAALLPQWTIGAGLAAARAVTGVRDPSHATKSGMPVRDPDMSLREIGVAAALALPGAVLRRRLFWRYTLSWRSPGGTDA